jgi:hypothetical protein
MQCSRPHPGTRDSDKPRPGQHPAGASRADPPAFARLARDHARLRAATEVLDQAATGTGTHASAQVVTATRDLIDLLQRQLPAEELALAAADEATDAAVDRIMRTRSGEDVELQSARELAWVWRRINQLRPGAFGVASSKGAAPVASSGHQQASSQSLTAERPATRHGGSASFRAHPAAS